MVVMRLHVREGGLAQGNGQVRRAGVLDDVEVVVPAKIAGDAVALLEEDGVPGPRDHRGDGRGESARSSGVPAQDADVLLVLTPLLRGGLGLGLPGLRSPRGEAEHLCHGTVALS